MTRAILNRLHLTISKISLLGLSLFAFGSLALMPASVSALPYTHLAAASAGTSAACSALGQLDPSQACGSGASTINKVVKAITNIISVILGIVGVIMVMISGFKYVTSNGDAQAVGSAKRTLIYALVGLVVAALAQFMVHFVINKFM